MKGFEEEMCVLQAWGPLGAAEPRGRGRPWRPGPAGPPSQMLPMLEGPLGGKGAPWKGRERAAQCNRQKGRRLVTTAAIPPSPPSSTRPLGVLSMMQESTSTF